ncbi:MAG: antitoxin [Bacteroidota bacterium]
MRLSIEVSPEQHHLIKSMAAIQGKSIRELVLDRIFNSENDEAAWQELLIFLQQRIAKAEAIQDQPTPTLDEIAEGVLKRHESQ